jgi:hypothetical protein
MGQIDEQKEIIGVLKVVFTLLYAAIFTIVGWLAQNILIADKYIIATGFTSLALLGVGNIIIFKKLLIKIKKLGEI